MVAATMSLDQVVAAQQPESIDQVIVIVIDVSSSMGQNNSLGEAKAAATLACALLRGRVALVVFSDRAEVSPIFDLATQRDQATAWISNLRTQGGTKYLQALDAVESLQPRAVVFVSDGAPEEHADAILNRVRDQIRCPLHTIAVQAGDQARDVLGRMAATSKAGFHVVAHPSEVIDTFLDILGQIRRFRRHEMSAASLALPDVQGDLVAIGLDARPELAGATERQEITLGGRPILVVRASYAALSEVTVSAPEIAPDKRVVVLRFDQPSSRMKLGPVLIRDGRAQVEASSSFHDPDGGALDPRGIAELSALFEAVDSQGQVIQSVTAKASPTQPALVATLDLPIKDGAAVPFTVRLVSDDRSSGVPFRASESQVVVVDPATAARAPAVSARGRTVAADALQLLVVAHRRRTGRVVLLDSYQQPAGLRHALAGDAITVELVRGKDRITPPEFASLGGGLRARLTRDDGSVEDVPLSLDGDRFTTERRLFPRPGRLGVRVAVEGLNLQLEGQIRIELVALRLIVRKPPAWQTLSVLPQWTVTPLEVSVAGTIENRPADAEDIQEVIERDGLRVVWSLLDNAGESMAGDSQADLAQPWRIAPRLPRTGDQSLKLELVDRRDQVRHALGWKFRVLDSPLRLEAAIRSGQGELVPLRPDRSQAPWLPRFFLKAVPVVVIARPSESEIYTVYHLAECRVGPVSATFNKASGQFEAEVEPAQAGRLECTGILRPYLGRGPVAPEAYPELHVIAPVPAPPYLVPRWDRLTALGALGLLGIPAGYVVQRRRYLRRIEAPALKARLLGASAQALPIVEPNQTGWGWPSPEIVVCRKGPQSTPWNLGLAYPSRPDGNRKAALAVVRQHPDGTVSVRARCDLPGLKAGRSRPLAPGDDFLLIADGIRMVLEHGTPATRSRRARESESDHSRIVHRALQAPVAPHASTEPDTDQEIFP
jgi:hypothetical protein